ncbi:MAG: alpha/beta hydrolase [Pseudomonadota bacterium]
MSNFLTRASRTALLATMATLALGSGADAETLELSPCRIDAGSAIPTAKAMCGKFKVPEDYAAPEGRHIQLNVAWIPALSVDPKGDPLVFFAGGPGQGAIETYLIARGAFEPIRQDRPILLVDQRGTGDSNLMTCPLPDPQSMADSSIEDVAPMVRECLDQLPGDPRFYTTSVAALDLDQLRQALNIEQLNLWGGSYGTRMALHYMRQFPEHTRSVIIDGVAPADFLLGPEIATDAQKSADALFDRCSETPACADRFGDLGEKLRAVKARLSDTPVTITINHPRTGEPSEQIINADVLAAVVRLSIYSPTMRALLPTIIDQAHSERYELIGAQSANISENFIDSMAMGMHNAVVCTEDAPFYGSERDPTLADTFIGESQLEFIIETCAHWPAGVIDDGFKEPVVSDIPVLLLSGEMDPVTPPSNAEHALATLSNARHIVAPGQGHIVSGTGCIPRLMDQFVDSTLPGELDPTCTERLRSMPIFVGPAGPTP